MRVGVCDGERMAFCFLMPTARRSALPPPRMLYSTPQPNTIPARQATGSLSYELPGSAFDVARVGLLPAKGAAQCPPPAKSRGWADRYWQSVMAPSFRSVQARHAAIERDGGRLKPAPDGGIDCVAGDPGEAATLALRHCPEQAREVLAERDVISWLPCRVRAPRCAEQCRACCSSPRG